MSSCGDCKMYEPPHHVDHDGQCRAHPPGNEGFPRVLATDWCGEWQPRPAKDEAAILAAHFEKKGKKDIPGLDD